MHWWILFCSRWSQLPWQIGIAYKSLAFKIPTRTNERQMRSINHVSSIKSIMTPTTVFSRMASTSSVFFKKYNLLCVRQRKPIFLICDVSFAEYPSMVPLIMDFEPMTVTMVRQKKSFDVSNIYSTLRVENAQYLRKSILIIISLYKIRIVVRSYCFLKFYIFVTHYKWK